MPQVIADLEVNVVGPGRAEQLQRSRPHHLAIAGDQRQLRREQLEQVGIGRRRALEQRERANMHRDVLVLDEEESGVKRAHPFHGAPPSTRAGTSSPLRILPMAFFGSSSRNSITRGYL